MGENRFYSLSIVKSWKKKVETFVWKRIERGLVKIDFIHWSILKSGRK
jgi:hypothetical protein